MSANIVKFLPENSAAASLSISGLFLGKLELTGF
jgi:hypothetical protein